MYPSGCCTGGNNYVFSGHLSALSIYLSMNWSVKIISSWSKFSPSYYLNSVKLVCGGGYDSPLIFCTAGIFLLLSVCLPFGIQNNVLNCANVSQSPLWYIFSCMSFISRSGNQCDFANNIGSFKLNDTFFLLNFPLHFKYPFSCLYTPNPQRLIFSICWKLHNIYIYIYIYCNS